ncbi:MAG: hypothetical protein HYY16_01750 [Planctomycetes bacterium]|nr:hypothetical protein [Planctomycetota bacterium]
MWMFLHTATPITGPAKLDVLLLYGGSNGISQFPDHAATHWALFMMGGILFACLYGWAHPSLPGGTPAKGLFYGLLLYGYAVFVHVPLLYQMAGAGARIPHETAGSWTARGLLLAGHLVYGATLDIVAQLRISHVRVMTGPTR